jgi:hypothetical protein
VRGLIQKASCDEIGKEAESSWDEWVITTMAQLVQVKVLIKIAVNAIKMRS